MENPPVIPTITEEEDLPTVVRGMVVGSKEEARVSVALDKLGYEYYYQYQLFGGRNVRGGQVIDFIVLVPPKPIPIYVQGRYWHSNKMAPEDQLKIAMVDQIEWLDTPTLWYDDELTSVQDAINLCRRDLGGA